MPSVMRNDTGRNIVQIKATKIRMNQLYMNVVGDEYEQDSACIHGLIIKKPFL